MYQKFAAYFKENPKQKEAIRWANRCITYVSILAYPILLLYLLVQRDVGIIKAILVPLVGFLVLSVFRAKINRPRPYEVYDISPVLDKDTKGKSFPSRHVFSAMVIALTFCLGSPFWQVGIILIILAILLAAIRVVTCVHFVKDVCAGAGFALFCAILGYLIW